MESNVRAILLVPTAKHRNALIGDEVCGGRAPVAVLAVEGLNVNPVPFWVGGRFNEDPVPDGDIALVLAWEGKPVPAGVFRGWQAWGPDEDPQFEETGWTTYDVLAEALDSLKNVEWLAHALERCGIGHVVLLEETPGLATP